jgi:alkyl hydroperoxide reductase subunit AhpC
MGVTFPLLSDARRQMTRAYGALNDDPKLATDPATITSYLRAQRAYVVIDKQGVVRFAKTVESRNLLPNDEILRVLNELK